MEITIGMLHWMNTLDGTAFHCVVLLDGKPRLTARNDGLGGETLLTPLAPRNVNEQFLRAAWKHAETLPKVKTTISGRPFEYQLGLDGFIERLVTRKIAEDGL